VSTAAVPVPPGPAVVDGVDVDAVAAAVRGCPAVEDLHAGDLWRATTYLPGRRVEGVRVDRQVVAVQVRARWGVDVFEIAGQVRRALAPLVAGRRIDVVVADVGLPAGHPATAGAVPPPPREVAGSEVTLPLP
jgi:hypothetical protein